MVHVVHVCNVCGLGCGGVCGMGECRVYVYVVSMMCSMMGI